MLAVDTDIMVDVLRRYPPALHWLHSLGSEVLIIPGFVVLELLKGCRNEHETATLLAWVGKFRIYWPTENDCNRALARLAFGRLSRRLSIPDLLIAETAVGLDLRLCTFNVKHFQYIRPGVIHFTPWRPPNNHPGGAMRSK